MSEQEQQPTMGINGGKPCDCDCCKSLDGPLAFEAAITISGFTESPPSLLMPCEDVRYGRVPGHLSIIGN